MKIIHYIFILLGIISCNPSDSEQAPNALLAQDTDSLDIISHRVTESFEITTPKAIEHLKELVENYADSMKFKNPIDSLYTKPALLKLRAGNRDTLAYYLTRLFIKKYRFQMECCNQGYELRSPLMYNLRVGLDSIAAPLLYEFLLISKTYEPEYPIDKLLNQPFELISLNLFQKMM